MATRRVLGVVGSLIVAIVAIVVLAFRRLSKATTAQHLPVSVTGPAAAVTALEDAMATHSPDAFDFVQATDRGDAVTQIETRQTYGAVVLGDGTTAPEALTAPTAAAAATQILTGVATQLQAQLDQQVEAAGVDPSAATVAVTPVVRGSVCTPRTEARTCASQVSGTLARVSDQSTTGSGRQPSAGSGNSLWDDLGRGVPSDCGVNEHAPMSAPASAHQRTLRD